MAAQFSGRSGPMLQPQMGLMAGMKPPQHMTPPGQPAPMPPQSFSPPNPAQETVQSVQPYAPRVMQPADMARNQMGARLTQMGAMSPAPAAQPLWAGPDVEPIKMAPTKQAPQPGPMIGHQPRAISPGLPSWAPRR